MSTSLFGDVIFGPVHSRRLGLSLGVNLLPVDAKLCNFNCIYCECGWNGPRSKARFNSREKGREELERKLREMGVEGKLPDVITFAGNGEPTLHPQFEEIIGDTIALRDELAPRARIAVLSNATLAGRPSVRRALLKVDENILKLDSAFDRTVRQINGPQGNYSVADTVENLKKFDGRMILQTMFLRGSCRGETVDNATEEEVNAWLEAVGEIRPSKVMIYTIDRDTPAEGLQKVSVEELNRIAERVRRLGTECSVAG